MRCWSEAPRWLKKRTKRRAAMKTRSAACSTTLRRGKDITRETFTGMQPSLHKMNEEKDLKHSALINLKRFFSLLPLANATLKPFHKQINNFTKCLLTLQRRHSGLLHSTHPILTNKFQML